MDVGEYIGNRRRSDEPRGYGGIDRGSVEPLPPGYRVPNSQGAGERDPPGVICFIDGAMSVKFNGGKTARGAKR